jgi:DNA-directed RNA polymerase specialized sigma24 family protein
MGGLRETFLTTHWSLIEGVQKQQDPDHALIGLLLARYWKPVYCYLRRKGFGNEQAKDLTQGFFHEVVLNRHLVERADPAKGSFRSLLLHTLRQYVIDERRKETALRQIPKEKLVSLDLADPPELPEAAQPLDPEQAFNYAWKADLLERVLREVKESYVDRGMETHWRLFHNRVLQPVLQDCRPLSLKEICTEHGIESEARASHMLDTVKRRFHEVLRRHVRQTVASNEDVEEELGEIIKFLKK